MTIPAEFEQALKLAYEKSDRIEEALQLVEDLTHAISESVAERTSGRVVVHSVARPPDTLGAALAKLRPEESSTDRWLYATNRDYQKPLWSVHLDADSAYPIEVRENDDTVHACHDEDALRAVFVELLSSGSLGSTLRSLEASAPPLVRDLLDTLQNDRTNTRRSAAHALNVDESAVKRWLDFLEANSSLRTIEADDDGEEVVQQPKESEVASLLEERIRDVPPKPSAG